MIRALMASKGAIATPTAEGFHETPAIAVASANSASGRRRNGNWTERSRGNPQIAGMTPIASSTQSRP